MKFGDTLYQRSIPQWAAYNVNYNEIKQLIKERTSSGAAGPVSIPGGSSNGRWGRLEDELVTILKSQHDNVTLFLNSKYGEIDRRLSYLEKQVKTAQKRARLSTTERALEGRKYRKLLQDAEAIGQEIQNLTRFAGVQKTAFRKLLKKYRKWTGSMTLRIRLENEVLAAGQLNLDYEQPLERLAGLINIIRGLQSSPSDRGQLDKNTGSTECSTLPRSSTVARINAADKKGPLAFDAALAISPYGESAGSATYWIHPDNLDEAQALLLRHVCEMQGSAALSRQSSNASMNTRVSRGRSVLSHVGGTHIAYLDNTQRFLQDASGDKPSRIALSASWGDGSEAVVMLSNLALRNPSSTAVSVRRKDISRILNREAVDRTQAHGGSRESNNLQDVLGYLAEHRDVKPLAEVHIYRSRFAGLANSDSVGVWATLDSEVGFSPYTSLNSSTDQVNNVDSDNRVVFPHAILEIRWELTGTPEIVRALDKSHLVEKVRDFTLESAAIHMVNQDLPAPSWVPLLDKDIRKVPTIPKVFSAERSSLKIRVPTEGMSSGTSSTDGPEESVFSAPEMHSSAASMLSPDTSTKDLSSPTAVKRSVGDLVPKKKKLRIIAESPPPRASRYWNEFDDGDEDVNPHEAYMISVNPDEPLFPGAESIAKAITKIHQSIEITKSRLKSLISLKPRSPSDEKRRMDSRSHLLGGGSRSNSDEADSSDSDMSPNRVAPLSFGTFERSQYRPRQVLTPRQKSLERTYLMFYTGLILLSYVLLFICGVLLATGRKKAYVEIDIAVAAGIAVAEVCAVLSLVLLWMRRMPLSVLHKGLVMVAACGIVVVGAGEILGLIYRPIKK